MCFFFVGFFFFKQKTAYEIGVRLVGSEMCIRDRAVAGIAYAVYRYFTPDYLEDFEDEDYDDDDFEDEDEDFEDDFFEEEDEKSEDK